MGAETSYVAQNTIIVHWFHDKEMALAMGLSVSAGRLGSFCTFNVNLMAVEMLGTWKAALWLGAAFALLASVAALIYCLLDKMAERILLKGRKAKEVTQDSPMSLSHVRKFPMVFWIICLVVTCYYSVIFPFQSTGVSIFKTKYGFSNSTAGLTISLLPLTSLFFSPIFGVVVDKIGKRVILVLLGLTMVAIAFLTIGMTDFTPIPSVIAMGIAYALVPAALWPCLPYIIEEKYIGTAFGLMSSLVNAGMVISYYLQGWVFDWFGGDVEFVMFFYTVITIAGLAMTVLWYILDLRDGGRCSKVYLLPQKVDIN